MTFSVADLKKDVRAGIVVALVAMPLCLGVALASNAPLISGLIAGIIGGLVVTALSGSQTSVSGPAAGLTVVVAAQIEQLGSFELFLVALICAGIIQIILGLLRSGFLAAFFPNCVIKGLLAGIGLLLILKQIPHLLGEDSDPTGDFAFNQINHETTLSQLLHVFQGLHVGAMIVGACSLLLLVYGDRIKFFKKNPIPLALWAVLLGVGLNSLFEWILPILAIGTEHLVQIPSLSSVETVSWARLQSVFNQFDDQILISGFTIAIVASMETLLNLNAIDKLDPKNRYSPPNRELVAQGVGNMLSGFFGGLPVTSVIVRSSVNISAGNATRFSGFFHGLLLVMAIIFYPILNKIPLSCLAAILVITGLKLASPKLLFRMHKEGMHQLIPFLTTILGIIFTNLLYGILIGFFCAVCFILYSNYKRAFKVETSVSDGRRIVRVKLPQYVSFLAKPSLQRSLEHIPRNSLVQIDGRYSEFIDCDIQDLIADFQEKSQNSKNYDVELIGLRNLT